MFTDTPSDVPNFSQVASLNSSAAQRPAVHVGRHGRTFDRLIPRTAAARGRQAGDQPGDCDVEERRAAGERLTYLDHRAERAGQRRKRQEEGQRRVDAVAAAGDVMPHLVRAENPEDGGAVTEGVGAERPEQHAPDREETRVPGRRGYRPGPEVGDERGIMVDAKHSRRDDRHQEQQDVQPPPVLEPAEGWQEGRVNGQPPMFWRSLPGLKRMVRPGGIRTSLPVRGLRPIPRFLGLT